MPFSDLRRDLALTLLHEEMTCVYSITTPSHKSHLPKIPGLPWGGLETSAGIFPCTLPCQDSRGATCLLLYSLLPAYAPRSPQVARHSTGNPQYSVTACPPHPRGSRAPLHTHQARLERCRTPPLRYLIWSLTQ